MHLNEAQLEKVGSVTEDEKNEVMNMFERIMGLKELLPILESGQKAGDYDKDLYDRAINDLGATTRKQQEWWSRMANKYNWKGKGRTDAMWRINFLDNTIFLQETSL